MGDDEFETEIVRWRRAWSRQGRAASTFEQYVREVRAYRAWCDAKGVVSASLDSADEYVGEIEERSRHMARMAGRAIRSYGKYVAEEYEEVSPFQRLRLPKEPEPTKAPTATQDDLERLLAVCVPGEAQAGFAKPWDHLRDQAIILMMADTGMRRGEVAGVSLDDLDLAEGLVNLPKTKSGAARRVYLSERVVGAILRYLRASEGYRSPEERALFLSIQARPHGGLSASGVGQMLAKRGQEAGVDVRAHAFRRMHAGEWMRRGGSETGLKENSGWTTTAMISRYTKDTRQRNAQEEARRLFE